MPEDLSVEQRRALRDFQGVSADPRTQERIREVQLALALNPQLRLMRQGLVDAVEPTIRMISTIVNAWVERIDWDRVKEVLRTIGDAVASLLPPNARALGTGYWPLLERVAKEEQLCLSWVPDADTARSLLHAPDGLERERLLVSCSEEVLSACDRAVRLAIDEPLDERDAEDSEVPEDPVSAVQRTEEVAHLLRACIKAAQAGHTQAAQALATCVIDTLIEQHINRRRGQTHSFLKKTLSQSDRAKLIGLVIGPTLAAAESSFRQSGKWSPRVDRQGPVGPVPYSRNATVHAACEPVFTEATALKAVLLATSVFLLSINPLLFTCFDLLDAGPLRTEAALDD